MDLPWFEEQSDTVLLDEYVVTRESYRRITADQEITEAEVRAQVQKVIGLLKQLESLLTPEVKQVATEALCELAVLHVLRTQQQARDGLSDFKRDETFATGPEKRITDERLANVGDSFYASHVEPDRDGRL